MGQARVSNAWVFHSSKLGKQSPLCMPYMVAVVDGFTTLQEQEELVTWFDARKRVASGWRRAIISEENGTDLRHCSLDHEREDAPSPVSRWLQPRVVRFFDTLLPG